jgi:hypothetical protein
MRAFRVRTSGLRSVDTREWSRFASALNLSRPHSRCQEEGCLVNFGHDLSWAGTCWTVHSGRNRRDRDQSYCCLEHRAQKSEISIPVAQVPRHIPDTESQRLF